MDSTNGHGTTTNIEHPNHYKYPIIELHINPYIYIHRIHHLHRIHHRHPIHNLNHLSRNCISNQYRNPRSSITPLGNSHYPASSPSHPNFSAILAAQSIPTFHLLIEQNHQTTDHALLKPSPNQYLSLGYHIEELSGIPIFHLHLLQ